MSVKRLLAVIFIFIVTSIAWMILGTANYARSNDTYSKLSGSDSSTDASQGNGVQQLWGQPQIQPAPVVKLIKRTKTPKWGEQSEETIFNLASSKIKADINYTPRRKGLLWYSTYKIRFDGNYTIRNTFQEKHEFKIAFAFPGQSSAYDNVSILVNGKSVEPNGDLSQGVTSSITLDPGQTATMSMGYGSQGLDEWRYKFGADNSVTNVKDFEGIITTNCTGIDFPAGCISPTDKSSQTDGEKLIWKYGSLVSGSNIGISMPHKLNPGPFAAKISYFAPVSLLFFFAVLLILGSIHGIRLHPMHYMLLAAAFFAFHLLFSYLVDHVLPFYAFLISSVVSVLLVVSYLKLVTGWKFAVFQAGLWQVVFLVLFTYAFFFEGYTGLTITIGAILTLALLMQMTGRVNWDKKLSGQETKPQTN